jgi:hypothetical protein
MRRLAIISAALALIATEGAALALSDCRRITHPSHGGEFGHRDLGEGRVIWVDWWTQEGSFKGFSLVDCGPGEMLRLRSAEENMGRLPSFDRTDEVVRVLDRHQSGDRVFATFERIAADLEFIARGIEMITLTEETCACAAAYPDLRGEKTEFVLEAG